MVDRHKMAELHEEYLAVMLGGRKTRGSGNQWNNPMDGRHDHQRQDYAFAWDGKSAAPGTKSIGVSREMWQKACDQSHGERPMLALRFYDDERCQSALDLVCIRVDDLVEILAAARGEPDDVGPE